MKRILAIGTIFLLLSAFGCTKPMNAPSGDTSPAAATQDADGAEKATESGDAADSSGLEVKSYEELVAALQDESVAGAHISESITISSDDEQTFEREGFLLSIDKGAEVTIGDGVVMVFFGSEETPGFVVNGTLKIAGELDFGAMTLQNNGVLEVLSGGILSPGMSVIENRGTLSVDPGGTIRLERGTGLQNYAVLNNAGEIDITGDGGSLINASGATISNHGHITFDGDYQNGGTYTGAQQEP